MNIYSVLESDDEDKPKTKVVTTKVDKVVKKPATFEAPIERDPKSAPKKEHHSRHGAKDHHNPHPDNKDGKKRQFDRKSGTGRGKEVAKGGAGGANWGSDKLEALKAEKHIAGDAEIPTETVEETEEVAAPVEPEPTVFTLDEYNRRRAEQQKSDSEAFTEVKLREVNADFSGLKTKEDEQSDFITLGAAKAAKAKKDQRSSSKTVVLDVAFTAAPTEQPEREPRRDNNRPERSAGRGRGGDRADRPERGAGRGGDRPRSGRGDSKGRGPARGAEGRGPAPNRAGPRGPRVDFNDASAFPSL